MVGSKQKLPEESTDFPFKKQWKTKDNSPRQAAMLIPQVVETGETDQFSPSLSLRSTTCWLQKLSGQRALSLFPLFPQDLLRLF